MRIHHLLLIALLCDYSFIFAQDRKEEFRHHFQTSVKKNSSAQFTLKLFIQGYYREGGYMVPVLHNEFGVGELNIVDTIHVLIHSKRKGNKVIDSHVAILYTNGCTQFKLHRLKGRHFISIKTRNGIETWSSRTLRLNRRILCYDFTKSMRKAFKHNMIEVEDGVWAFYCSDVNQDGIIDSRDLKKIEDEIKDFQFGYRATDINGDGNVDLLDRKIIDKYLDVNNDTEVNDLDYQILARNPKLVIRQKRPRKR